jgi:hypothetical protein
MDMRNFGLNHHADPPPSFAVEAGASLCATVIAVVLAIAGVYALDWLYHVAIGAPW